MRLSRIILPFLLPGLLLGACKKDASEDIIDFGPSPGFQYRTGQNLPVGASDPTDWVADSP